MINISSTVVIYRPAHQVFDFISAAANDFEWQYGTLASGSLTGEARRVGGTFRTIGHLMGHRTQGTFEVTECEPNRRYGFKSLSGPLHLNTLFTLDLENGRTRVNVATQASPVNSMDANERVMEKFMQKQLREDLAMLKSILEGRGVGSQTPA